MITPKIIDLVDEQDSMLHGKTNALGPVAEAMAQGKTIDPHPGLQWSNEPVGPGRAVASPEPFTPVNTGAKTYPIEAVIYDRRGQWVLELAGSIENAVNFTCRHEAPEGTSLHDVASLDWLYPKNSDEVLEIARELRDYLDARSRPGERFAVTAARRLVDLLEGTQ